MKDLHLALLAECNERCLFCAKGPAPQGGKNRLSLAKAVSVLGEARNQGYDNVSLDGGEPTLRPDLDKIIQSVIEAGYRKITVMTNAVALSEEAKVVKLANAHARARKLVSFCVSLHSHRAAVSEKLTRSKNTFPRTLKGIDNLIKAGFQTDIYHLITAWSYKDLPEFAEFVADRKIGAVTFSYIYPVLHNFEHMYLYPKHSAVRPYFKKALRLLEKKKIDASLSNCSVVPYCLLKDDEKLYIEAYKEDLNAIAFDMRGKEKTPFFLKTLDLNNREKHACCRACAMDKVCGGTWKFYAAMHGTDELGPYKGTLLRGILRKLSAEGGRAA